MDFESQDQKKEEARRKKQDVPSYAEKGGRECPRCGRINETEAKYCEECGQRIQEERLCPSCGSVVSEKADICEHCGDWVLTSKCKFCYADLEEGQSFCGECGNPVEGIDCPECGSTNFFDFCKDCNKPLTEKAKKTLEDVKAHPELAELNELKDLSNGKEAREVESLKEELLKMRDYLSGLGEDEDGKKPIALFSTEQKEMIQKMSLKTDGEIKRIEEEERRLEEERIRWLKRKRQRRRELYEKMASKTFKNNQQARRFHDAIKPKGAKGWLCNFTSTLHSCPAGCCEPWHGGYWVV